MPDEKTYGFNIRDATDLLNSIGSVEGTYVDGRVRGGGNSSIKHVYPPSGGIPAATWDATTERMTPSIASCRVAEKADGQYRPTSDTVMVENPVGAAVGISGKPMTIGKNTSGAWTVLVEDCSGSSVDDTGGPLPDPEDPLNPEFTLSLDL
jgi:hypothetical protein